ncbi:hypothetical protein HW555_011002 [Spodoptera exigua]|uniref:PiggyBac transposable element-derived protein domain-containing protein n=1 Tax=Spodoptera exigua TaxID=7107 RepID=A0A835G630_SPOEX|nr:hypothetical protein HW555_011002 [Spodoptera exigua]
MAPRTPATHGCKIKPKWHRTRTIMALVPPENAPSDGSSSGSDDKWDIFFSDNEDHQSAHFNPVLSDEEIIPKRPYSYVTKDDICDFIGITLLMGVVQMPAYRDYWSKALRFPENADIMTLKKYEKIRRFLHFVDNTDTNDDRYFKVRPVLERIRELFAARARKALQCG